MALRGASFAQVAADDVEFAQQLVQRRQVEVTFEQGRARTEQAVGLGQQGSDRVAHRRAVGVDLEIAGLVKVAGDVDVGNALAGQGAQEAVRVVTVVGRIDHDVVDVQQQLAVGALEYGIDEVDLGHRARVAGVEGRVMGDVLDRDAPAERVLGAADARGDVFDRGEVGSGDGGTHANN